jgi:hypothetical protein
MMNIPDDVKQIFDTGSGLVVIGSLFDALPKIAAGFAILWYCTRLWEWWRAKKGGRK